MVQRYWCIGISILLNVICAAVVTQAAETSRPANERFATGLDGEVPDFQRHVIPLLGRLGCNGRACHGSFQGRGGFQLSLFGYDFATDHKAIRKRIKIQDAGSSLLLHKPLEFVEHEGGQRFASDSWQHNLLHRWIKAGAKPGKRMNELRGLTIVPNEVVFAADSKPVQLRVIAEWQDGSKEDVTPICRFRTNDDSVVSVTSDGLLKSVGAGDSHVIAFYDNGVASVPVMRPVSARTTVSSTGFKNPIDRFVAAKLSKLGIAASELCSDTEFLRRVSIDLTGTLPTPKEVQRFLSDQSGGKRQRKIDELLRRPSCAAWWATRLCDFTGCNPRQQSELGQQVSVQWYMWIYARLLENRPYDSIIEGMVVAQSRATGESFEDFARKTTSYFQDEGVASFAQRSTMPHYWTRRSMQKPEERALAVAHNFLGLRLQCAQCHKHPFAPWTKQDFQQFTALLSNVQYGVKPANRAKYKELARKVGISIRGENGSPVRKENLRRASQGAVIPWREIYLASRKQPVSLKMLRSKQVDLKGVDDPRVALMTWMKEKENPWFAKAIVNRVWAGYFNVGIVEPPDDFNPANPPSHPELLDWLSRSFVENNYDLRWLHRQIVSSATYQRSWRPNTSNKGDRRNFSRAIPRRIPAEVVYDGVKQALAATDKLEEVRTDLTRRATGHLSMWLAGTYGMHVFGKPDRAVNCDCERLNQPTLLQSIFMQNDPLIEQRVNGSGWIAEIEQAEEAGKPLARGKLIRDAWLRSVGRYPTDMEVKRAEEHLQGVDSTAEGMRDLMWALLNTKEFILNQ